VMIEVMQAARVRLVAVREDASAPGAPPEGLSVRRGISVLMPNEQSGDQASASSHSFGDASSTQLPAGSRR
jgi:hypothetical protein